MAKEENFYSYLKGGNEAVAMDKMPKQRKGECYTVFCRDTEGTLRELIEAIGKHGNGGHSYEIVLDPDCKEKESFFWDGDGSDRINQIIDTSEECDNPVVRMCLQTLASVNQQVSEVSRTTEEFGEPPLTEEKKKKVLDDILHDTNLLVKGCQYHDDCRSSLRTIREFIKNAKEAYGMDSRPYTVDSLLEDIDHIDKIAAEGLEKGITFNA